MLPFLEAATLQEQHWASNLGQSRPEAANSTGAELASDLDQSVPGTESSMGVIADQDQGHLQKQDWSSDLHWSRTEAVSSTGAGLSLQPRSEQD